MQTATPTTTTETFFSLVTYDLDSDGGWDDRMCGGDLGAYPGTSAAEAIAHMVRESGLENLYEDNGNNIWTPLEGTVFGRKDYGFVVVARQLDDDADTDA